MVNRMHCRNMRSKQANKGKERKKKKGRKEERRKERKTKNHRGCLGTCLYDSPKFSMCRANMGTPSDGSLQRLLSPLDSRGLLGLMEHLLLSFWGEHTGTEPRAAQS